jgi:hypothetical protein
VLDGHRGQLDVLAGQVLAQRGEDGLLEGVGLGGDLQVVEAPGGVAGGGEDGRLDRALVEMWPTSISIS